MSGVPSPESAFTWTIFLPLTPPAALMSCTARSTPANSGGPRNARSPVCGSRVPMVRVPSPLPAAPELGAELVELVGRAVAVAVAATGTECE